MRAYVAKKIKVVDIQNTKAEDDQTLTVTQTKDYRRLTRVFSVEVDWNLKALIFFAMV
jgi:hypothetical protein